MADLQIPEGNPSLQYVLLGAASLAVVLACGHLLSSPSSERVDVEKKRGDHRSEVLKKLRLEEEAKLSKLEWVNKESGLARIPIETSMRLTAKELASKPAKASAVKVEPILAAPSGDAPAMPSAPGGAFTIQFPQFSVPLAPQPPQQ
jgi:hypothetical protein